MTATNAWAGAVHVSATTIDLNRFGRTLRLSTSRKVGGYGHGAQASNGRSAAVP